MVEKLVKYLKECDDAYYNSDQVIVSNDTYDALVETLRRLDPTNPYLNKVGAPVKEGTTKVGRMVPMGTLSKYKTEESVREWLQKNPGLILIAPKYDGFGVELTYQNGKLIMASTRGSGHVGEDVLEAVMKIPNVPTKLPEGNESLHTVRGEAIIPRKYHEDVKKLGYTAMRNAVPGIVRSGREDALQYVEFVAYEFFDDQMFRDIQRETYEDIFNVEDYIVFDAKDFEHILSHRNEFGKHKDDYIYELDGVVLKTVFIEEDDLLCPSHQIAWKFKSNRETTILRDIEYQMGVSGYFTPIGIFDEVEFQGAKLKRASLGNMTRLSNEFEGMTIGSVIEVSRRGDIIPYIEELIRINFEGDPVKPLTSCPHCGHILGYDKDEPVCINKSCPEKLRLQISQFARAIGVKGIGDKLIRGLIDAGHIESIIDVYEIDPEVIRELPRQGSSSVEKWRALQEKELSTLQIFSCYPFLDLGEKVWKLVFSKFSYEEILDMDIMDLTAANIKGLGAKKIESIITQVRENREELIYLLNKFKR